MRNQIIILLALTSATLLFSNVYAQQTDVLSPLKQIKLGLQPTDIKCKEGLVLLWKTENGNPSCVKPSSTSRLMSQGWVTPEEFKLIRSTVNNTSAILLNNTTGNIGDTGLLQNSNVTKLFLDFSKNSTSSKEQNATNEIIDHSNNRYRLFSSIQVNPTISTTKEGTIKIISIGMYPNPLKVGDVAMFSITFQNVSNSPINLHDGCTTSSLLYTISPSDSVLEIPQPPLKCSVWSFDLQPNEIYTLRSMSNQLVGYYQIIKPNDLNVDLMLDWYDSTQSHFSETINFDVNATQ